MKADRKRNDSSLTPRLDRRLAAYLAGGAGLGAALQSDVDAAIVGDLTERPFGINEEVNIDFNGDGQFDFQIDHDRVDLNGTNIDYLQLDKNDVNSAANPLPIDAAATFDLNGTAANNTEFSQYVVNGINTGFGDDMNLGSYPAALNLGDPIGPDQLFDFQEGDNFAATGNTIRANRLIDEDMTQIDQDAGTTAVQVPFDGPNFAVADDVNYLGVRFMPNGAGAIHHGWIGIRIDNVEDATGAVVGYAYNDVPDAPIAAGAIPEPSSIVLAAAGGLALSGSLVRRRAR